MDPSKVEHGVATGIVAIGTQRLMKPNDGLVVPSQFHQVRTDVIVGVAKLGVDGDGAPAFGDGVIVQLQKAVNPTQKRMRLGGGVEPDRVAVASHGLSPKALCLQLVALLKERHCGGPGVRIVFA